MDEQGSILRVATNVLDAGGGPWDLPARGPPGRLGGAVFVGLRKD